MYSILKPCKTSAAFEAIPRGHIDVDIPVCERGLCDACTIVAQAGVVLIVRDLCEVSIFRNGRLIMKTDSEDLARKQVDRIACWFARDPAMVSGRSPLAGSPAQKQGRRGGRD